MKIIKFKILKVIILSVVALIIAAPFLFCADVQEEKFGVAAKAFSDGFYDASRLLFERFVEEFPKSSLSNEAKLYIAKCYYYSQNYPKSLEVLGQLEKERSAKNVLDEIYYWQSIIYLKGKNFTAALNYSQRIVDDYPDSKFRWPALYLIGKSSLELGKTDDAQQIFNRIIRESKNEESVNDSYEQLLSLYFSQKDYSRLQSLANEYLKKFPKSKLTAKIYFYLAESYYAQGKYNDSLEDYLSALERSQEPELKDLIYQGLGFAYLAKGKNVDAKVTIDKIGDKELRLFSQGLYYFKAKNYVEALETFDIFVKDYPQSKFLPQAYLNKADVLYEMGRLNDSINVYRYVLDNFTESKTNSEVINKAHYGLAWCYLKNGRFKEAIDEFKSTLEYADNPIVKVSSQIQIADAYQETGKYDEALDIYNDILRDQPNTIYADYIQFQIGMCFLRKTDLEKSFFALRNLKNNFPSSRLIPQAQYYLAVGYFSRQDYGEAQNLLRDLIDKFPQESIVPKAKYLYGKCFFNEGKYSDALEVFKQIVGKSSDKDTEELAFIDMGNAYLNLSSFNEAKEIWKEFERTYPSSQYRPSVILYLGGLYEKEGDYTEAQRQYQRVIDGYRGTRWAQEALFSLGHLYWQIQEYDKAQSCFEQLSQEQTPLALKAKLYLAKVFEQKGENQKALDIYNQLIDSELGISKAAFVKKAFLLKEMNKYDEAIVLFRKAIADGIDTPEIIFSLGLCLEKIGKNKEAIEEYFRVIYAYSGGDRESSNSDVKSYAVKAYFRVARIYEQENNIEAAKKIYQKIVDLGVEESKIAKVRLEELNNN